MNWTEILKRAGVPEPPGREDVVARIAERKREAEANGERPAEKHKHNGRKRRAR